MHSDVPNTVGGGAGGVPATRPGNFYAYHDFGSAAKLSTTVVHALADVMRVDIRKTGFSLYDSVDPDALDRIFAPAAGRGSRPSGHVAFAVRGSG